jgi:hypothetical protein
MEQEEKILIEQFGRQNPFRVPEGYFDSLTERVMTQLPERKPKSRLVALRPWFYAAACFAVVAVVGLTYHFHQADVTKQVAATEVVAPVVDNSYVDEAADYAMLDNVEIYAYLAEAEL